MSEIIVTQIELQTVEGEIRVDHRIVAEASFKEQRIRLCSVPSDFQGSDLRFFAADVKNCIVAIGGNQYGYFFRMPLTLLAFDYWTEQDLLALPYFAREYLAEQNFEHETFIPFLKLQDLCALVEYLCEFCRMARIKEVVSDLSKNRSFANSEIAESFYSNQLAQKLHGDREVRTPSGNIDVLTATEVIEVKKADCWKDAVGQVLSYVTHYPQHIPRIHLFGNIDCVPEAKQVCESIGIRVTHEE